MAWFESHRGVFCALVIVGGLTSLGSDLSLTTAQAQEQTTNEAARRQFAAAAALQNREQFELAADEWQRFLKDFSSDVLAPRARHYLGLCQLKAKQYSAAAATLDPLVKQAQGDLLEATLLYLGLARYNLGHAGDAKQYDPAEAAFRELIQKYPQGKHAPQAHFYLGESAYGRGQREAAVKAYQQVVDKFPKDALVADALYAIGVTSEELKQSQAAGQAYDKFLKEFPSHSLAVEVNMRRGETLLAEGKLDEAEKRFAAAAKTPGFTLADHALMRQAAVLYQKQQYPAAADLYASLAQQFPQSRYVEAAQLAAGKCAYLASDFARAAKLLTALKDRADDSGAEAGHWLVLSLLKQKQTDEALTLADALLKKHTSGTWVAQLALDRADVLYEIPNRQKEAGAAYASVADRFAIDPVAPQARYLAAYAALNQGDYDTAIQQANAYLTKFKDTEQSLDVRYIAAESYLQKANYPAAEEAYGKLVKDAPQHRDLALWQLRRATCAFLQKDYAKTIAQLKTIAGSLPTPAAKAEAHYLVGASHIELQQHAEAITALRSSLQADAKWRQADETRLALAQALRQSGQADAARKELEQLLTDFPQSATRDRARFRLAELAFAANDFARAVTNYRELLNTDAKSSLAPHALYGLGWSQFRGGDAAAALKTLDDLLKQHAQSDVAGQARYLRALVKQDLKQPAQAIEDLEAYLKTKPTGTERSNALYALGLAQNAVKQSELAIKTFRDILKNDPKYADADKVLYELAWSLKSSSQEDQAAETFAQLAKDYPQSTLAAESLYHVGDRRYEQKQWKEAARAYYAAQEKAGTSPLGEKASHKLGWTYFQQENYASAAETFAFQAQSWPQGELVADGQFMTGESFFKQEKFKEALAAFTKVQNPPRKELLLLAKLHSAQSASALQDWQQSKRLADQALAVDSASPYLAEILYEQAWAQQNLGKGDEAMVIYEEVTSKSDAEVAARARFMIGEILFERKQHKEAIRNFFKVAYAYNYPEWQAAAHYEAARCFEVLKDTAQAKKSYQEVVDKFPQSSRVASARERLAALGK